MNFYACVIAIYILNGMIHEKKKKVFIGFVCFSGMN